LDDPDLHSPYRAAPTTHPWQPFRQTGCNSVEAGPVRPVLIHVPVLVLAPMNGRGQSDG
jgi:hypothetical protein